MTSVGTLPIRVSPLPGEAIDSWLEAQAARSQTAWGDLMAALGLSRPDASGIDHWIVQPLPEESTAIAAATGIDAAVVTAMTLSHYAGRALWINAATRAVPRTLLWRGRGSRYCPRCLAETGGRWQLAWRLGWAFACLQHHCLLADVCPSCGEAQRTRSHIADAIPAPHHCANPPPGTTVRTAARCGADLTTAVVHGFPEDHPVLSAQRIVYDVIADGPEQFGVYRHHPQPSLGVLADIRAVAHRVLAYGTDDELAELLPGDLVTVHRDGRVGLTRTRRGRHVAPGRGAPGDAVTAAVGVTAALTSLNQADVPAAGTALRWLVSGARDRGLSVSTSNVGWGRGATPTLTAVQIAALAPYLKPSAQLRYRATSPRPAQPFTDCARAQRLIQCMPTMFWPAWSLQLAVPTIHQRYLRPALSAATLLVGTRITLPEATRRLASPLTGAAVSRTLGVLHRESWNDISAALTVLADHLADTDIPIDYQRRRQLDYATLLPDSDWKRICRDTATPGRDSARAQIVRCYLFERLSGLPVSAARLAVDHQLRRKVSEFPRYLTAELSTALDHHCADFLNARDIRDEPTTWEPALALLGDAQSPGNDARAVDIDELQRLIRVEHCKIGVAADRLGTTWDTARYLLTTNTAPNGPATSDHRRRRGTQYRAAKSALTPQQFRDLYQTRGIGLSTIAAAIGADRRALVQLAGDYGIRLRRAGDSTNATVDRDWLYGQYVHQRRSIRDLARERGITRERMAQWIEIHDIPKRPVGGPPHRASIARAPRILHPALAGRGGWERLRRFAAMSTFATLGEAAAHLQTNKFTLVHQLNRIERELGKTLLTRAQRGHPMRLTDDGVRVLAEVKAYQRQQSASSSSPRSETTARSVTRLRLTHPTPHSRARLGSATHHRSSTAASWSH